MTTNNDASTFWYFKIQIYFSARKKSVSKDILEMNESNLESTAIFVAHVKTILQREKYTNELRNYTLTNPLDIRAKYSKNTKFDDFIKVIFAVHYILIVFTGK